MRNYLSYIALLVTVVLAGCSSPTPPAEQAAAPAPGAVPAYHLDATVKDVMDSVIDFNADYIWDSVATESTLKGTVERAPRTDAEWKDVRKHTIALLEGTNLLQIPGRAIAKPGEKSENPGIELGPEEILVKVMADPASWNKFAGGLYDATMVALKAIEAKDKEALLAAGDGMDRACESCHMNYWYPDQFKNIQKTPNGPPDNSEAIPAAK